MNNTTKILGIEKLRGIAVLGVLISHFPFLSKYFPGIFILAGHGGVLLFFVISGFVITRSLWEILEQKTVQNVNMSFIEALEKNFFTLKYFIIKRFFRIVPMALVTILIYFAIGSYLWKGASSFVDHTTFDSFLRQLLSFFTFRVDLDIYTSLWLSGQFPINTPGYWTLSMEEKFYLISMEEKFYLILPIIMLFSTSPKNFLNILISIICSLFLFKSLMSFFVHGNLFYFLYFFPVCRFDDFAMGCALCACIKLYAPFFEKYFTTSSFYSKIMPYVLIFILLGTFGYEKESVYMYFIAQSVSVCLIFMSIYNNSFLATPILKNIFSYVGSRSYTIYLLHQILQRLIPDLYATEFIAKLTTGFPEYAIDISKILLLFCLLLVMVEFFYNLIEKPLINYGRTLTRKDTLEVNRLPLVA